MKSLLDRVLRACGSMLKTLARPLVRKVDGRIGRLIEETVRPMIAEERERHVRPALDATAATVRENMARTGDVLEYLRRTAQEDTLLLDSLVRELIRVQGHLESLRQVVEDQDRLPGRSSRQDDGDRFATIEAESAGRLMIG